VSDEPVENPKKMPSYLHNGITFYNATITTGLVLQLQSPQTNCFKNQKLKTKNKKKNHAETLATEVKVHSLMQFANGQHELYSLSK